MSEDRPVEPLPYTDGALPSLGPRWEETLLSAYRWMRLGRALDGRMQGLQRQGRVGFYGAATGQEAVNVAAGLVTRPERLDFSWAPRAAGRARPWSLPGRLRSPSLRGRRRSGPRTQHAVPSDGARGPLRLDVLGDRHPDQPSRRSRVRAARPTRAGSVRCILWRRGHELQRFPRRPQLWRRVLAPRWSSAVRTTSGRSRPR